jgi:hypothetical protein
MGKITKPPSGGSVTLTLSAQHARTLLTALTHAIHGGGLKSKVVTKGPKPK